MTNVYFELPPAPVATLPTGAQIHGRWNDRDDPLIHIGLFFRQRLLWAQAPEPVLAACAAHPDTVIARSEYGETITGRALADAIEARRAHWDLSHVGRWFRWEQEPRRG